MKESGVAYYTASGNQNVIGRVGSSTGKAIASWQTSEFRGMPCPSWAQVPTTLLDWECLDFDPSAAEDATDTLFFDEPASPVPAVSWAQPVYGVSTSLIPQLYVDGAEGAELVSGLAMLDPNNPVIVAGSTGGRSTVEGEVDLVILRPIDPSPDAVPSTPAVWTSLWGGYDELAAREYDTSVGEDRVGLRGNGHEADGSAIGVAAVNWRHPDVPEQFSSPGAGTMYFEPVAFGPDAEPVPSPAYPVPLAVPGPWVAAVDGDRTSFFGDAGVIDGVPQYFFFGTSAAAPNAAAVHALALELMPGATADTVARAAVDTARSLRSPLAPSVTDAEYFGPGLIDANAMLGRLSLPAPTGLDATALSDSSIAVAWADVAGAVGYRVELLSGERVVTHVDTDAATTATTLTGLQGETTYTVRVAALSGAGAGASVALDVTTRRAPQPATPVAPPSASDPAPEPTPGFTATPARVVAGEAVTVTGLPARGWVQGVLFSAPAVLGWAWTGTGGSATFTIPASVPAGSHRLAVQATDGTVLGWVALEVTVPAPVPAAVPAAAELGHTGMEGDLAPTAALGALAVFVGAGLAATGFARSRRATR